MNQDPEGPSRAPRDGAGPRRTYQCPTYGTSQGSAGRIRGPAGQTRTPQYESGSFGTDLGPQDQSRPRNGSGPAERINVLSGLARAPQDE